VRQPVPLPSAATDGPAGTQHVKDAPAPAKRARRTRRGGRPVRAH